MPDKCDECGCHRDCTQSLGLFIPLDHICSSPCSWPDCLTENEHVELGAELAKDFEDCPTCEMIVSDCEMYGCPRNPESMQVIGLLRKYFDLHDGNAAQARRIGDLDRQVAKLQRVLRALSGTAVEDADWGDGR